jgi:transcriptional regulator with XRE-family HTH domain
MNEMQSSNSQFSHFLRERFDQARLKNRQYSLRAFAKTLGLAPSMLSMVLSGKRGLSYEMSTKILDRLAVSPVERKALLSGTPSKPLRGELLKAVEISNDEYWIYSEWYYMAILSLLRIEKQRWTTARIAKKLGLTATVTQTALSRLSRVKWIEKQGSDAWKRLVSPIKSSDEEINISLRQSHFQTLDLAKKSLEEDALETRDFTWITFAMDPERIPELKTKIRNFQKTITEEFSYDPNRKEVYRVAIQAMPLSKINQENQNEK